MTVLLHHSGALASGPAAGPWFAVAGASGRRLGRRAIDDRIPDLGLRLETAFNEICPEWLRLAKAMANGPGAELAYATTCAGYGSDFGQMLAWGRLVGQVAGDASQTLVICDDPWLFRHLATLPGVTAGRPPALWPARVKLRARGFFARLRLIARLAGAACATRGQRTRFRPGDRVILVYGHPRSNAKGYDDYFGDMMAGIPALKRALHTDCRASRAAALAADGRSASLHAWGNPWSTLGLLSTRWRPTGAHLQGPYGWLIRRAAEVEGSGGAHAMNAWQRRCQEAWLRDARPSAVAWPWENHGWERAFCRTARHLGITTIGYQHTVIGPHQLNYSPATNVDGDLSLPDTVACDGPAYRDQLAGWGIDPKRMVIGGSLRIRRVDGERYDPKAPCFVALSANRGIARQQMRAVEAAAEKGFQFLVKDHPMYPLAIRESARIRRAAGTIPEQPALSAVLYSTGTSGLEALLAGLPTFRLLPDDQIAVDVLPDFLTAEPVSVDSLADALSRAARPRPVNWEDVLSPVDWALWRRLLGGDDAPAVAGPTPPDSESAA